MNASENDLLTGAMKLGVPCKNKGPYNFITDCFYVAHLLAYVKEG